jgi:dimethylhistidine N-methyltransferase
MPTLTRDTVSEAVLTEALTGLTATPKTLSPWLFYDEQGSQLFEKITGLPEYYLTRTERAIFAEYAPSLPEHLIAAVTVAELGAGSASKTGVLLREFATAQPSLLYQPIDISPTALEEAAASLSEAIPGMTVSPQVANYITDRYTIERPEDHIVLALYIGSSIGNFSPSEALGILRNLRDHLQPGDALLLGTDLAPGPGKTVETLLAAYDDAAGVTAAFNKNILVRLNRELDADFNIDCFAHRARWNAAASRIEMHLESLIPQTAHVSGTAIRFAAGETIHTENSYKFTEASLAELLTGSGFKVDQTLHDAGRCFAVTLAEAV